MNFKDYFQKQAEEQADKLITESDRQFCKTLLESNKEVSAQPVAPVAVVAKKPWYKQWSILSSIACAVCCVTIVVASVIVNGNKNPGLDNDDFGNNDDITYSDENILAEDTTYSLMNNEIKYFDINEASVENQSVTLYYDSLSNAKLYYTFKQNTDIAELSTTIVINEHYNYSFDFDKEIVSQTLDEYIVNYNKIEKFSISGTIYDYRGYIKVQTETVYFEYKAQEAIPEEYADEVFFDDIQHLISVKQ